MSTDRWMDKEEVVYIHNGILLSTEKELNNTICSDMDGPRYDMLNEVRQSNTNTMWYHLHVESKIWHRWTYLQNRNRLIDTEDKLIATKREKGGKGID